MSAITAQTVNDLRQRTGAGLMDCKKALVEANGDNEKAVEILRIKGVATRNKKADRKASEGILAVQVSADGRASTLLELNCETDFVAKNDNFRDFVKDITLHIAAAHPLYVTRAQVPEALITKEREIAAAQVVGKPANIVDKIVDGKIDKFYSTICLLEQSFIKNPDVTIEDLVKSKIAELGENIIIRRFTRYGVGEELA